MPIRGPHTWVTARERRPCTLRRRRHAHMSSRTGIVPRAGAAGAPLGQATPHTTRRIPWGLRPAPRRPRQTGPGAWRGAPGEAPDGAIVGDTHPVATGLLRLVIPPLDQERLALWGAGAGLWGGGPAAVDGEGTQVLEGCQQRGHMSG